MNIRTLVEIRGGQVRIQETDTETTVTITAPVGAVEPTTIGMLASQDRIKELEAEVARYQRCHVCTPECLPNQHTAFQGRKLVEELRTQLTTNQQAREIETQRAEQMTENYQRASTEIDRLQDTLTAAQQRADRQHHRAEALLIRAEIAESDLATARADARAGAERVNARLREAYTTLAKVRSHVLGTELDRELDEFKKAEAASLLVGAIEEVRRTLWLAPS